MKKITPDPEAYKLFHEGCIALAQVESNGIKIDLDQVKKSNDFLDEQIALFEARVKSTEVYSKWKEVYGDKANINSKPQLGDILYNHLKMPCYKYTPKRTPQVDEQAIRKTGIAELEDLIKLQKYKKLKGTYINGLLAETVDGFLHPVFNLHNLITFRSSSSDPNFQNLPTRHPTLAKVIRSCYVPRKNRYLVEIDFSSIEVKMAYCYHKDPNMKRYLSDPTTDMHRDAAADFYMIKPEQVGKQTRYCGKNKFVFPAFYGSVYFQCASALWESLDEYQLRIKLPEDTDKNCTGILIKDHLASKGITSLGKCEPKKEPIKGTYEYHVREIERKFWNERFAVYTQWKKDWYDAYIKYGCFKSYTGFMFKGLYSKNDVLNYSIQGTAFHCLLWSLIELQKWLNKNKMKSLIVGQIHDSMIIDVVKNELQDVLYKAKRIMTIDLPNHWKWINTKLETEVEVSDPGTSWFDKNIWIEKSNKWKKKPSREST